MYFLSDGNGTPRYNVKVWCSTFWYVFRSELFTKVGNCLCSSCLLYLSSTLLNTKKFVRESET